MRTLILIALLTTVGIKNTLAVNYTSNDKYTGNWNDNASWTGGSRNPGSNPSSNNNFNIYGYITHIGDLTFSSNTSINIYDTLVVRGNLHFSSNMNINIQSNGLLVVYGDFYSASNANTSNNRNVAILGEFELASNITINNNSHIYAYDNTPTIHRNSRINGNPLENETDLRLNDPVLYNFIQNVLPVELLLFQGREAHNEVVLEWTTATEENFDVFEVERSADGRHFEKIGYVYGVGNASGLTHYAFTDEAPMAGNNYYRLKMVDLDQTYEYSPLTRVTTTGNTSAQSLIYPNPVNHGNTIHINTTTNGNHGVRISIHSFQGELLHREQLNPGSATFDLPATIEKGTYLVRIEANGNRYNQKVMVL